MSEQDPRAALCVQCDREVFGAPDDAPPISTRAGRCGGKPCISGTRVTVEAIQSFAAYGYSSAEQIREQYPHLTIRQIEAALAFKPPARSRRRRTSRGVTRGEGSR